MRLRQIQIFIVTLSLCLLPSCRSSKHGAASADYSRQPSAAEIKPESPKKSVESLVRSYEDWSDVAMSFRCNLRSPKNISVSGKASMIRGKEIKISLRMLGFEVAGLYADKDSLFVYEKLNRTLIAEPMGKITSAAGITLSDIQNILLGQLCAPGQNNSFKDIVNSFAIEATSDNILLATKSGHIPWLYTLTADSPVWIKSLDVELEGKGNVNCNYSVPLLTEAGPASPSASIKATVGKQSVDASFEWSLETASWNKNQTPSRQIPNNYRRISALQLIKVLSSF